MELTEDYRKLLQDSTVVFEEFLNYHFENAGYPWSRKEELFPVFTKVDTSSLLLNNLILRGPPPFKINRLAADLLQLHLDVDLKTETLEVTGHYEIDEFKNQEDAPVTYKGDITIKFSNIAITGKIGLLTMEDSDCFYGENFDVKFDFGEITSKLRGEQGDGATSFTENKEAIDAVIEKMATEVIWIQAQELLVEWLWNNCNYLCTEYSLWELLDNDEVPLKEAFVALSTKTNRLVDTWITSAEEYLTSNNLHETTVEGFDVVFMEESTDRKSGLFTSGPATISNLASLTRKDNFSYIENEERALVYGCLKIGTLQYEHGRYEVRFGDKKEHGSFKLSAYKVEIFIKVSVAKNEDSAKVESVEFQKINLDPAECLGLESFSWMEPKIEAWLKGNYRCKGVPIIENNMKQALDYAVGKTNCRSILF